MTSPETSSTSDSFQSAAAATAGDSRGTHRRYSPRRRWLFRLLAVALSLAPLLLLEVALRFGGYGDDTRLIIHAQTAASVTTHQFNAAADRAYFGLTDLSGPETRHFEIPKPPSTYRIVVVGGSTVAGFPYPFELALPRHLEVILGEQLPDMQFEVLNAGITSINSFSEVDIVRQAVTCEPDLIVVHSGHNEFYGPGGSASTCSTLTPALYPVMQTLRRQRAFQWGLSLIPRRADSHLVETLPADIAIPLDGTVFTSTESRYRANLEKIVAIAQRARIPLLLSSVPSNLRDLSPLQTSSYQVQSDSEAAQQAAHIKEAQRQMSYHKYEAALQTLAEARETDPTHPLLAFLQAQSLERLNRREQATEAYRTAADLDGCRFRAPSSFANVAREVVAETTENVFYCDVTTYFQTISRFPAPGGDLFLEHVHYNVEGHWQAARCLAECILEQVLRKEWNAERVPDEQQRDELLGITTFDHLVADAQTVGILGVWPFRLSPARVQEAEAVQQRWRSRFATLPPVDQQLFTAQTLESMTQHVLIVMGQAYLAVGQAEPALASFERHIHRRPWDAAGYVGAAIALRAMGKQNESAELLERARRIVPHAPELDSSSRSAWKPS